MVLIMVTDCKGGVLFNGRRQSRDVLLRQRIMEITKGQRLLVTPYSASQFSTEDQALLQVCSSPLDYASKEDFCFLEQVPDANYNFSNVRNIVLFRWDREYPADCFFQVPKSNWVLRQSREFSGFSHKRIIEEVFENETK